MDWMTTSPEAIRLTLSLKSFQNARNWPARLASVSTFMVRSISARAMLPFSAFFSFGGVFVRAGGFHAHRRINDADRGDVQQRRTALELGVQQVGPGGDGAA